MIIVPSRLYPIVNPNGTPTNEFHAWMTSVSDAIEKSISMAGNGSPEGVVNGEMNDRYLDADGGTIYKKTTRSGNEGWIAL